MLIYTAGQYGPRTNGLSPKEIDVLLRSPAAQAAKRDNIAHARRVAIALWEDGHAVVCPHLNTADMEKDCKINHADYLRGDFLIISRCDGVMMLEGWEESKGATMEHEHAKSLRLPIWYEGKTWPPRVSHDT